MCQNFGMLHTKILYGLFPANQAAVQYGSMIARGLQALVN
jgi:hypothetical protein